MPRCLPYIGVSTFSMKGRQHDFTPELNPALINWNGPHGLPRFEAVNDSDFAAHSMPHLPRMTRRSTRSPRTRKRRPSKTPSSRWRSPATGLSRISALFWNRAGAHTNDTIQALERDIAPKMSRHYSKIGMNAALFARIDALWERRESLGLDLEQTRVLERHWKGFVKSGAKLPKAEQERLAAINEKLAGLGAQFGQNVLADEKSWALVLDEGRRISKACRIS